MPSAPPRAWPTVDARVSLEPPGDGFSTSAAGEVTAAGVAGFSPLVAMPTGGVVRFAVDGTCAATRASHQCAHVPSTTSERPPDGSFNAQGEWALPPPASLPPPGGTVRFSAEGAIRSLPHARHGPLFREPEDGGSSWTRTTSGLPTPPVLAVPFSPAATATPSLPSAAVACASSASAIPDAATLSGRLDALAAKLGASPVQLSPPGMSPVISSSLALRSYTSGCATGYGGAGSGEADTSGGMSSYLDTDGLDSGRAEHLGLGEASACSCRSGLARSSPSSRSSFLMLLAKMHPLSRLLASLVYPPPFPPCPRRTVTRSILACRGRGVRICVWTFARYRSRRRRGSRAARPPESQPLLRAAASLETVAIAVLALLATRRRRHRAPAVAAEPEGTWIASWGAAR